MGEKYRWARLSLNISLQKVRFHGYFANLTVDHFSFSIIIVSVGQFDWQLKAKLNQKGNDIKN